MWEQHKKNPESKTKNLESLFSQTYWNQSKDILKALLLNSSNIQQNIKALLTLIGEIIIEDRSTEWKEIDTTNIDQIILNEITKEDFIMNKILDILKNIYSVEEKEFNKYSDDLLQIIKQYIHSEKWTANIYPSLLNINHEQWKENFTESALYYALEHEEYYNTNPFILSRLIASHIKNIPSVKSYYDKFLEQKNLPDIAHYWGAGTLYHTLNEVFKYRQKNTLPTIDNETHEKLTHTIKKAINISPTKSTKMVAIVLSVLFDIKIVESVKNLLYIECVEYLEKESGSYDIDWLAYYIYMLSSEEDYQQLTQLYMKMHDWKQGNNNKIITIIKKYLIEHPKQ